MRTMIAAAALALASPAVAQGLSPGDQILLDDLRMRQQAAERRAVDQANQLMALEARLQAERSVQDLRSQIVAPRLSEQGEPLSRTSSAPAAPMKFPSIPDAALAESNRRVQEAAGRNR